MVIYIAPDIYIEEVAGGARPIQAVGTSTAGFVGGAIASGGRTRVGLDVLEQVDEVAIVAAPGYTDAASYDAVVAHCEKLKDRVGILDAPGEVEDITLLTQVATAKASGEEIGRA